MNVGFGRVQLRLPSRLSLEGYSARFEPATEADPPLTVTAAAFLDRGERIVILSADVLAHGHDFVERTRSRIADIAGCRPDGVLVAATHTHASIWPGSPWEPMDPSRSQPDETEFRATLDDAYVRATRKALVNQREVGISWGVGHVTGMAVNRRERTTDDKAIIGWNKDADVDGHLTVMQVTESDGTTVDAIVSYACHPVVLGPEIPAANPDYVGPLRAAVEGGLGGLCLFLQGASGDVQPREALFSGRGAERRFGQSIAAEVLRVVSTEQPREFERTEIGRWAPTAIYRARRPGKATEGLGHVLTSIDLPLTRSPSRPDLLDARRRLAAQLDETTAPGLRVALSRQLRWFDRWLSSSSALPSTVSIELWVARIGDGAIVAIGGEPFNAFASAVRASSPASVTLVAGCAGPVIGYIPSDSEYASGGFEIEGGHVVYGQPSAIAPGSLAIIADEAQAVMATLFGSENS